MNARLGRMVCMGLWGLATLAGSGCQQDGSLGPETRGIGSAEGGGGMVTGGMGGSGPTVDGGQGLVVYYYALAYAPGHGRLTVAGDGGLGMFDPATGVKLKTVDPGNHLAVIAREGGDVIAAAQLENLWLFDAAGKRQHTIRHPYQVFSLAVAPDGSVVYSGGIEGKVRRFNSADGTEIMPALGPNSADFVNDLSVSSDGLFVAAAEKEGVRIWRTADGASVLQIPGWSHRARFAPSGREITVVGDGGTVSYAFPAGTETHRYDVGGTVARVAYSADGSKLALSAENNTVVKVFDVGTGAALVTLTDPSDLRPPEQPGFRDVSELTFVENDARVAVAWRSGRLTEWTVADGKVIWSRLDADRP